MKQEDKVRFRQALDFESRVKPFFRGEPPAFGPVWARMKDNPPPRFSLSSWTLFHPLRLVPVAGFIAAVVTVSVIWFAPSRLAVPVVTRYQGDVLVTRGKSAVQSSVQLLERLDREMVLQTGEDSGCEFQLDPSRRIYLESGSILKIDRDIPGKQSARFDIRLLKGSLVWQSGPESTGSVLALTGNQSRVAVVAGRGRFSVSDSGNDRVSVLEGEAIMTPDWKRDLPETAKTFALTGISVNPMTVLTQSCRLIAGESVISRGDVMDAMTRHLDGLTAAAQTNDTNAVRRISDVLEVLGSGLWEKSETTSEERSGMQSALLTPASDLRHPQVRAVIESDPSGAEILINGTPAGRSPVARIFEKQSSVSVSAVLKGYGMRSTNLVSTQDLTIRFRLDPESGSATGPVTPSDTPLQWLNRLPQGAFGRNNYLDETRLISTEGNHLRIYEQGRLVRDIAVGSEDQTLSKPVLSKGLIYVGSDRGGLYAFSADGRPVWSVADTGKSRFSGYPVPAGGYVFLPSLDRGVEIFTANGKLVRRILTESGEAVYAAPYYNEKKKILVFGTANEKLFAYDVSSEKIVWAVLTGLERILFPLTGNDAAVFVFLRNSGSISAFDLSTGRRLWQTQDPVLLRNGAFFLADNKRLYAAVDASGNTRFIALDAKTGRIVTRKSLNGRTRQLFFSGGKVVLVGQEGRVSVFHAENNSFEQ